MPNATFGYLEAQDAATLPLRIEVAVMVAGCAKLRASVEQMCRNFTDGRHGVDDLLADVTGQ